ncbi:hypothetical protein CEXT_726321 [Caerostris extrusa]|uniref:Uncharacterized protein n=1 Tax=Caerostris extrusa TaxID=172846 RepID=A0AAV4V7E6_CAEEX|nr:hypothetical protein CEXT_726321 [Caerostris extrusa]
MRGFTQSGLGPFLQLRGQSFEPQCLPIPLKFIIILIIAGFQTLILYTHNSLSTQSGLKYRGSTDGTLILQPRPKVGDCVLSEADTVLLPWVQHRSVLLDMQLALMLESHRKFIFSAQFSGAGLENSSGTTGGNVAGLKIAQPSAGGAGASQTVMCSIRRSRLACGTAEQCLKFSTNPHSWVCWPA